MIMGQHLMGTIIFIQILHLKHELVQFPGSGLSLMQLGSI